MDYSKGYTVSVTPDGRTKALVETDLSSPEAGIGIRVNAGSAAKKGPGDFKVITHARVLATSRVSSEHAEEMALEFARRCTPDVFALPYQVMDPDTLDIIGVIDWDKQDNKLDPQTYRDKYEGT